MTDDREMDDRLAEREAAAAAAEAGAIGGPVPDEELDPADRPVAEGGGGEAEGFELSERQLARQASHEDAGTSPTDSAFTAEVEADRSSAVYAEPDGVDPTETDRDPGEDGEDPGAGPGIAAER